jgi:hypothetical protein
MLRTARPILAAALLSLPLALGCADPRTPYGSVDGGKLGLTRVVLYRNGVGYFERAGAVDGDLLVLRVRKDQVNDLLKSLTIVERATGRAVSVSMPLDPQTWANAALTKLAPGSGALHEVLDALRGADVSLSTEGGTVRGRIVMVERVERGNGPAAPGREPAKPSAADEIDHKVTLLDGTSMKVVRLSRVDSIALGDGELALQFHRSLDASAGEGMFQQVDVSVRLAGASSHDLAVSYVVAAPMWKPTYRIVLPAKGKGQALLQGWAVVDNTSGEDWRNVKLSLTSGAPIAFRYDLHSPRDVPRADLSGVGSRRQARAAVGETTMDVEEEAKEKKSEPESPPAGEAASPDEADDRSGRYKRKSGAGPSVAANKTAPAKRALEQQVRGGAKADDYQAPRAAAPAPPPPPPPAPVALDAETLSRSAQASAKARAVSGLVEFHLDGEVTLPDGTSTMVALVNQMVEGEETYLFRPGGAGVGFDQNPYRVVRFRNVTPFVLEPGPISIYASGSFVGEGLSETVGTGVSATIPFAVEPNIFVSSTSKWDGDEIRLVKIARGVLEVENFSRRTTIYEVRAPKKDAPIKVHVRHAKAGSNYALEPRPAATEDLPDAYVVPIPVPAAETKVTMSLIEQTPSKTSITIWDTRAPALFDTLLAGNLPADQRKKIEPIVQKRQEIGRIDTQIDGLKRQQIEIDRRAQETRANLESLKRDNSAAAAGLRRRLGERLEQFTKDGDKLGRSLVELQSKRLERKIEVDDLLVNLDFTPPQAAAKAPAKDKK